MDERGQGEDLAAARQRAEEARRAWRKAREEMRGAFRRTRSERGAHEPAGAAGVDVDDSVQEMADAARDFASEVAEEARRLADELWHGAKHDWQSRWREQWQRSFGKGWQDHWVFGGRRFRQWASGGDEANPFVAAILSRGGGLLALYVLHLLDEQPRHGNEIMKQIEQRTMGSWSSNPGAIYPLLGFMEEKGYVQSRWEDPDKRTRRIYQVTEQGRQELERLRRVLRPKVMEAIEVLHVLYDDLYERGGPSAPTSAAAAGDGEAPQQPSSGGPGEQASHGEFGLSSGETAPTASVAEDNAAETGESTTEPGESERRWRRRLGRLFGDGWQQARVWGT